MKAKFLLILAAAASLFSSCDMDLAPVGSLNDDTAIQGLNDALRFRNGFYTGIRSFTTSKFFTFSDIQADMFNGLVVNGNRMGVIANGDVLASDGDITSYWLSCYSLIANTNYYLEVMEPLYKQALENNDPDTAAKYARFMGEAHFFRGYYYAMMFDRWCQMYSADKGDTPNLGLPIVTKWDPTPDRSKYPGRSTMNETIKFFKGELDLALEAISEYEETVSNAEMLVPNAPYISSMAITAFKARIELWLGNYKDAMDLALEVINSGYYELANLNNYKNMWTSDTSSEVIFRPYMSNQELSNSIGSAWIGIEDTDADYLPTPQFIAQLKEAGTDILRRDRDVRYTSFVATRTLQTAYGNVPSPCFVKFPGNPDLKVSSDVNLENMPKVFRLSEMYFIVMESACELNLEDTANKYLETYMKNRITGYEHATHEGNALKEEIRKQRGLELAGEGFRISDLRRWHKGFDRSSGKVYESNPDISIILTPAGLAVSYAPDDYRYTWPIPADELQSNPQITQQDQNPGY